MRKLTDADLGETVAIYEAALTVGKNPLSEVMRELRIARTSAARRMRQARERGLTSKTIEDKKNRDVLEIARLVGVDYEAMYSAVLRVTGGGLMLREYQRARALAGEGVSDGHS